MTFPFNGVRTWDYVNTDASVTYALVASMDEAGPVAEIDGTRLYSIQYSTDCLEADPQLRDR
jgi:hypothetical protein